MKSKSGYGREKITIDIEKLAFGGEGIAKYQGKTVFVETSCPGDRLSAEIMMDKPDYLKARIVDILEPSKDRTNPPCKYFYDCGACQLQHIDYTAQLRHKTLIVKETLSRIGGIDPDLVKDTVKAENIWGYRNKMQYPVRQTRAFASKNKKKPAINIGYFKKGTHDVVDIDDCMVLHPFLNSIAGSVRAALSDSRVEIYDEDSGRGFLRHILGRVGFKTKEALLCFVANGREFKGSRNIIADILNGVPGQEGFRLKSISLNENTRMTNVILGNVTKSLWGEDSIKENLSGLNYKISPVSFFQINPEQTEKLYGLVEEFCGLTGEEVVIDAYSGTGTIALQLSKSASMVYGIEESRTAVDDAIYNARANGVTNTKFICSNVDRALARMRQERVRIDVMVLDPPRTGCSSQVINEVMGVGPAKIIYVSCDTATLARDLKLLSAKYTINEVRPVDMFPHTAHIENVVKMGIKR